jgi:hydrogenase maturation protein HypF
MTRAPILVIGIGNPSRGDDALGPALLEQLAERLQPEVAEGAVELLTDFQLQIEHALDLQDRTLVFFVDASVSAAPPFELVPGVAGHERSLSTHAMAPSAVLRTYQDLYGAPPESWVLAIRGDDFTLGEPISDRAQSHLQAALMELMARLRGEGEKRSSSGVQLDVEGTVQGMGFRPWVCRTARALGLTGTVANTSQGVRIRAFGPSPAQGALVHRVQTEAPGADTIRSLRTLVLTCAAPETFTIEASERNGALTLALPPDLGTCADCLLEVANSVDRHHAYVFTSCVACGPRYSIALDLPFDRDRTSMAAFIPCSACEAEYQSPDDRRFHAQTIACPACGPKVWLCDPGGASIATGDAIEAAASLLTQGKILGVEGLGAFHLVCDATNVEAVQALRRRKQRDAQPFAVMVRDQAAAERVVVLDECAASALGSSARPIVLAPSRPSDVVQEVSGPSDRTGVMLPYTPMHHRLLGSANRPLVITSGNPTGGPPAIDRAEAQTMLGGLVDAFLVHDRPIVRRVEDSVVDVTRGSMRVLRRARGFAPTPLRLPAHALEPVLAVGGHMKNTACLVVGDLAYLTPHLGDLGLLESELAWQREVEAFEALLGVRAAVIAHDLHPDYTTTRFAQARQASRCIGVQHHAAHVLATIAEHHIDEPVIGVAYDGSGWGPDGTSWGGEIMIVDAGQWTRVASFRPVPLPGGEHAIRQVWRVALGALVDAFGEDEARVLTARLDVFREAPVEALAPVVRMIVSGAGTVRARGVGRWFDAVGALALALPEASFDGHVAMAFEAAALAGSAQAYPVALPAQLELGRGLALSAANEIDLRPTVRAIVADLLQGLSAASIAARFHQTLIEASASVVARALAETGLHRVVLTGGCFQNRILERGLVERLGASRVLSPRRVPVNDGGIALGQAWAAVLALEGDR